MDKVALYQWVQYVKNRRPQMDVLAQSLIVHGATMERIRPFLVGELTYQVQFRYSHVVTTITFLFLDRQTTADLVVTHITTLPSEQCRQGFGSRALQALIAWATQHQFNEIRAVQVSGTENEAFWQKHGFGWCPAPNPCNDFVRLITPGGKSVTRPT